MFISDLIGVMSSLGVKVIDEKLIVLCKELHGL